jgi:alkanesulfonate monooxygenase SsuD/methylene tetrahydromethanopterin reductase-like flavin-dependent oxidoreductase (luciferase family)
MKIGIGLPTAILNVSGDLVQEWAMLAEKGPFSCLSVTDRLAYRDLDSLMSLALAAGVTEKIRLMTAVLLSPLRNTSVLAKQIASLDVLSNGRLSLGLGIGGRQDDYRAASISFQSRGKRFDQQLEQITGIWKGQPVDGLTELVGPTPVQSEGPELLIGAFAPAAIRRLERWGNGYIGGGGYLPMVNECFRMAEQAWQRAGRPGKPRLIADLYFGLGPEAVTRSSAYLLEYHAALGPMAQQMAQGVLFSPEAIRAEIQAYEEIGADEVLMMPCIAELDQVHRLIDSVNSLQL